MRKILTLTIPLLLTACIADPSYDPSKLDTEMTVLKGAEFKVPDTPVKTLDDIFDLDGVEYIACNENGDYEIRFALDPVDKTVYIPESDATGRIPVDAVEFCPFPTVTSSDGTARPIIGPPANTLLSPSGNPPQRFISSPKEVPIRTR